MLLGNDSIRTRRDIEYKDTIFADNVNQHIDDILAFAELHVFCIAPAVGTYCFLSNPKRFFYFLFSGFLKNLHTDIRGKVTIFTEDGNILMLLFALINIILSELIEIFLGNTVKPCVEIDDIRVVIVNDFF